MGTGRRSKKDVTQRRKLTKRVVESAEPWAKRYHIWDTEITGFCLRVGPDGSKRFYLKYRTADGRVAWPKIGNQGDLSCKAARDIALKWSTEARGGGDPSRMRKVARHAATMRDLAERYLGEHARPHKKPSSVRTDESNLDLHVLPNLGSQKVRSVTRESIIALHHRIGRTSPGAANRVLALLSKMFNLGELWGLRDPGSNPCRHVTKYKGKKIERALSPDEYARVGIAINELNAEGQLEDVASGAIRLLIYTGCRLSEVLTLRWRDVSWDARQLVLPDSKTGAKRVPLTDEAIEVLRALEMGGRRGVDRWVFERPGLRGQRVSTDWIWWRWKKLRARAKLPDLRIHDLRHAFASVAAAEGLGLPVIGAILGHRSPATTARYAHLLDAPLRAAATEVTGRIRESLAGTGKVIRIGKKR